MNRRNSFFEKIQRFMYGRYGQMDGLNKCLLWVALLLYLLAAVFSRFKLAGLIIAGLILNGFSIVAFVLIFVRILSKNVYKRSAENLKYYEIKNRIMAAIGKKNGNTYYGKGNSGSGDKSYKKGATTAKVRPVRDPAYKYFKCLKCKKTVRVPKNHGKVELTCKNCGHTFVRYTGKRVETK